MAEEAEQLRQALRAALPVDQAGGAARLADVLTALAAGRLESADAQTQIAAIPGLADLLRAVANQEVKTETALIRFGDHSSIGDVQIGSVAGGDILTLHLALNAGPSRPLSLALVVIALATLVLAAIVAVLAWPQQSDLAVPPPNFTNLQPVGTMSLAISALAATETSLWIGAVDPQGHYLLYEIDIKNIALAPREHLRLAGKILDVHQDCRGNLWLRLEGLGTLVYRPATGAQTTLLTRASTNDWLTKDTMYALASRCGARQVDVWLARDQVQHLSYQDDYPTIAALTLDTPDQRDQVADLHDVRALLYTAANDTLWIAGRASTVQLRVLSLSGALKPIRAPWNDDALWALSLAPDGSVWAGGNHTLARFNGAGTSPDRLIALRNAEGLELDSGARSIVAGRRWVWFGDDRCPQNTPTCWPLSVLAGAAIMPVPIRAEKVYALIVDQQGTLWVGTDIGLFRYPQAAR